MNESLTQRGGLGTARTSQQKMRSSDDRQTNLLLTAERSADGPTILGGRRRGKISLALMLACLIAVFLLLRVQNGAAMAGDMDGVIMQDGKVMFMKHGQPASPIEHEVTLSDGTKVEGDGTVKSPDGKETHLQNGQMIMMDGHIMSGGSPAAMSP